MKRVFPITLLGSALLAGLAAIATFLLGCSGDQITDSAHPVFPSPDQTALVYSYRHGDSRWVLRYDGDTGALVDSVNYGAGTQPPYYGIAFSPDGTRAYHCRPGMVWATKYPSAEFLAAEESIGGEQIAISPDGAHLLVWSGNEAALLDTSMRILWKRTDSEGFLAAAMHPLQSLALVNRQDTLFQLSWTPTGVAESIRHLSFDGAPPAKELSVTGDGTRLVAVTLLGGPPRITVWSLPTLDRLGAIEIPGPWRLLLTPLPGASTLIAYSFPWPGVEGGEASRGLWRIDAASLSMSKILQSSGVLAPCRVDRDGQYAFIFAELGSPGRQGFVRLNLTTDQIDMQVEVPGVPQWDLTLQSIQF